jgi:hypothetical protein
MTNDPIGVDGNIYQKILIKIDGVMANGSEITAENIEKMTNKRIKTINDNYIEQFGVVNGKVVDNSGQSYDDAYSSTIICTIRGSQPLNNPNKGQTRPTARRLQCGDALFISNTKEAVINTTLAAQGEKTLSDLFKVHSNNHASNGLKYVDNTFGNPNLVDDTWEFLKKNSQSGDPVCDFVEANFINPVNPDGTKNHNHGFARHDLNLGVGPRDAYRRQTTLTGVINTEQKIQANVKNPPSGVQLYVPGSSNYQKQFKLKIGGKKQKRRRTNKKRKTKRRRRRTYKYKK